MAKETFDFYKGKVRTGIAYLTALFGSGKNPDGSDWSVPVDVIAGNVTLQTGDIQIGAVELKNSGDDTRATVGASGLHVDVRALPALPAGTNNIGDVDVLTLPALPVGTNSIGGTKDNGPHWSSTFGVGGAVVSSADMSGGDANLTDVPTAGQKLVVTDIILSSDAALRFDLKEETSGTIIMSFYLAANSSLQITPRSKLKLATADKRLVGRTSAAGNVRATIFYYSEA